MNLQTANSLANAGFSFILAVLFVLQTLLLFRVPSAMKTGRFSGRYHLLGILISLLLIAKATVDASFKLSSSQAWFFTDNATLLLIAVCFVAFYDACRIRARQFQDFEYGEDDSWASMPLDEGRVTPERDAKTRSPSKEKRVKSFAHKARPKKILPSVFSQPLLGEGETKSLKKSSSISSLSEVHLPVVHSEIPPVPLASPSDPLKKIKQGKLPRIPQLKWILLILFFAVFIFVNVTDFVLNLQNRYSIRPFIIFGASGAFVFVFTFFFILGREVHALSQYYNTMAKQNSQHPDQHSRYITLLEEARKMLCFIGMIMSLVMVAVAFTVVWGVRVRTLKTSEDYDDISSSLTYTLVSTIYAWLQSLSCCVILYNIWLPLRDIECQSLWASYSQDSGSERNTQGTSFFGSASQAGDFSS